MRIYICLEFQRRPFYSFFILFKKKYLKVWQGYFLELELIIYLKYISEFLLISVFIRINRHLFTPEIHVWNT